MPKLDGTGPLGLGTKTGRKLGLCSPYSDQEKLERMGKGMGKKHHSGGGQGQGKRLRYSNTSPQKPEPNNKNEQG